MYNNSLWGKGGNKSKELDTCIDIFTKPNFKY